MVPDHIEVILTPDITGDDPWLYVYKQSMVDHQHSTNFTVVEFVRVDVLELTMQAPDFRELCVRVDAVVIGSQRINRHMSVPIPLPHEVRDVHGLQRVVESNLLVVAP